MAEVKWIKLAANIFDNRKIKQIETLPDGDTIIVIWLKLLCLAGEVNDRGMVYFTREIPYTDQMLSGHFNRPLRTVQAALKVFEQFGMIELIDDILHVSNWEKYQNVEGMDKIREQNRLRKQRQRERQKLLLQAGNDEKSHVTITGHHATEKEIQRDIDKDKEQDINTMCDSAESPAKVSKKDIDEFFEYIWSLYPVKKGKGQVSESKRKTLYNVGVDEMKRAIDRYLSELKKDDWRKPQNGSTFFNSGYVDYLDENFEPQAELPKNNKPASQLDESYRMMAAWAMSED